MGLGVDFLPAASVQSLSPAGEDWLVGRFSVSIRQGILGTEVHKSNGEMGVAQALCWTRGLGCCRSVELTLPQGCFPLFVTRLHCWHHFPSESGAPVLDCAQGLLPVAKARANTWVGLTRVLVTMTSGTSAHSLEKWVLAAMARVPLSIGWGEPWSMSFLSVQTLLDMS